ncbi:MAG: hypothetical protein HUK00_09645 [Bacteroidaceae bacterium]|nr:hypothetical protein [Bacteroidaceae bacterium]MCF0195421.1 hypothetical protein [Bacteroidaceae bacterium]
MLDFIFDAIGTLFDVIGDVVAWVIDGFVSLAEHVTNYFRALRLRKGRDIPFVADETKIADLIHKAPVKNVGIFEATYNEDTDEIENYRAIEADEMDDDLRETLGNEKLVVLS